MNEAIKLAIEKGGYGPIQQDPTIFFQATGDIGKVDNDDIYTTEDCVDVLNFTLDPLFWSALGKARGWSEEKFYSFDGVHSTGERMPEAKWYYRGYMELKWSNGDEEKFWKELLK